MSTLLYRLNHSVNGELRFDLDRPGGFIKFSCCWPYDLSTNEWINISNCFSLKKFVKQVSRLSSRTRASVQGLKMGKITLERVGCDRIQVSVSSDSKVQCEEWRFPISARPCDLMPKGKDCRKAVTT